MSAFTPFLNLYKPGGGSSGTITPDEVADVDRLNADFDIIDAFALATDGRLDTLEAGYADAAIALNGGWTNVVGAPVASVKRRGKLVSLNGRLNTGAGATTNAFVLPVGFRPAEQRVTSVQTGGNSMQTVIIGTDGVVTFFDMSIPTTDYRLASIPPWPAA